MGYFLVGSREFNPNRHTLTRWRTPPVAALIEAGPKPVAKGKAVARWHDRMVELAREHSRLEAAGDLAGTLATLADDCVYEMHPAGRVFRGIDNARIAYTAFFKHFRARTLGSTLRQEWVTDDAVGMEYTVTLRDDAGEARVHSVIGIITFGAELLSGERVYASEDFFRLAYGPAFVDAEPWDGPTG